MDLGFKDQFQQRKSWFDSQVENYLAEKAWPESKGIETLKKSFAYSLDLGGKRFRPVIALMIGETFGVSPQRILPWALAVEMIHTYSLIHDDLPCMDNDDFRRGEPTNHKVFGESIALLAGDVLQTEAFQILADKYQKEPAMGFELVRILAKAIGAQGMVSGQAIDMSAKDQKLTKEELFLMHALKTGALIQVAAEGAAVVCGFSEENREACRKFGQHLGLAFQLKDDLLDREEGKVENLNFTQMLEKVSLEAKTELRQMNIQQGMLVDMIDYNLERDQ